MKKILPKDIVEQFRELKGPTDQSAYLTILAALSKSLDVTIGVFTEPHTIFDGQGNLQWWRIGYDISRNGTAYRFVGSAEQNSINRSGQLGASDKLAMRSRLFKHGVRVPLGGYVSKGNQDSLSRLKNNGVERITVKPTKGSLSRGVFVGVSYEIAVKILDANPDTDFVVEQSIIGPEFRLYVVNGNVVKTVKRTVPYLVGDGNKTINDLLQEEVARRRAHPFDQLRLLDIKDIEETLVKLGLTGSYVPDRGFAVAIKSGLVHGGGDFMVDFDIAQIPGVAIVAERASKAFAMDITGVDIRLDKAGTPYLLEVNNRPGLAAGCLPSFGHLNLDTPGAYLSYLFPESAPLDKRVKKFDFQKFSRAISDRIRKHPVRASSYARF